MDSCQSSSDILSDTNIRPVVQTLATTGFLDTGLNIIEYKTIILHRI